MMTKKYRVEGYIKLLVAMTVEAKTVESAASKASGTTAELATKCMDVLKDKASNLAHDLATPPSGHVTSVTSLDD